MHASSRGLMHDMRSSEQRLALESVLIIMAVLASL